MFEGFNRNLESAEKRAKQMLGCKLLLLCAYRKVSPKIFADPPFHYGGLFVQNLITKGAGTVDSGPGPRYDTGNFLEIAKEFGIDKDFLIDPHACSWSELVTACEGRKPSKLILENETAQNRIATHRAEQLEGFGFTDFRDHVTVR